MSYGMYGFLDYDEEPPKLYRYRVLFFDTVAWEKVDVTLLAQTEQQCRTWADTHTAAVNRQRTYPEGTKDSLQIIKLAEVTLPLEV